MWMSVDGETGAKGSEREQEAFDFPRLLAQSSRALSQSKERTDPGESFVSGCRGDPGYRPRRIETAGEASPDPLPWTRSDLSGSPHSGRGPGRRHGQSAVDGWFMICDISMGALRCSAVPVGTRAETSHRAHGPIASTGASLFNQGVRSTCE